MKKDLGKLYDGDFYAKHIERASKSAAIVLGLLFEHYKPHSVLDVGCGQGAWLASAESLGARTLKGMDGKWVREEALLSKNIDFSVVNFEETVSSP